VLSVWPSMRSLVTRGFSTRNSLSCSSGASLPARSVVVPGSNSTAAGSITTSPLTVALDWRAGGVFAFAGGASVAGVVAAGAGSAGAGGGGGGGGGGASGCAAPPAWKEADAGHPAMAGRAHRASTTRGREGRRVMGGLAEAAMRPSAIDRSGSPTLEDRASPPGRASGDRRFEDSGAAGLRGLRTSGLDSPSALDPMDGRAGRLLQTPWRTAPAAVGTG